MSSNPNQKPLDQKTLEQRLHETAARAEEELRRLVRYLDDEVVPEVRRNSSTALRAAAVRLQKLAESMDNAHSGSSKPDNHASKSGPEKPGSEDQR